MDAVDILRAVLALAFVVALILGGALLLRRQPGLSGLASRLAGHSLPSGDRRRLIIQESLHLDPRHRLSLITVDGREHLVLMGPQNAQLHPMPASKAPDRSGPEGDTP